MKIIFVNGFIVTKINKVLNNWLMNRTCKRSEEEDRESEVMKKELHKIRSLKTRMIRKYFVVVKFTKDWQIISRNHSYNTMLQPSMFYLFFIFSIYCYL